MAYLAVDKDGTEALFLEKPVRINSLEQWAVDYTSECIKLPAGSCETLLGKELTWNDEAVKI